MTGLHTGHSQIRDNFEVGGYPDPDELGQMPLDSGTYTIGRMLQDAGYRTGVIGKWGLGGRDTWGQPRFQGFDYFFGYLDQQLAHNYYPTHLWRNGERVPLDNEYFPAHQRFEGDDPYDPAQYARYQGRDYSLDVMADDALRFLDERQGEPFFLYLPFAIPHLALQVPDSALAAYDGAFEETPYLGDRSYLPHPRPFSAYAAMITRMDAHIGRILERLDELGTGGQHPGHLHERQRHDLYGRCRRRVLREHGGAPWLEGVRLRGGDPSPLHRTVAREGSAGNRKRSRVGLLGHDADLRRSGGGPGA